MGRADETIEVRGEVVNLITPKMENYYHWIAEGLSRSALCFARCYELTVISILLSYKYFYSDDKVAPKARILMPNKA